MNCFLKDNGNKRDGSLFSVFHYDLQIVQTV